METSLKDSKVIVRCPECDASLNWGETNCHICGVEVASSQIKNKVLFGLCGHGDLFIGCILGTLVIMALKELGVLASSFLIGAAIPPFCVFGIAYLSNIIRKKIRKKWLFVLIIFGAILVLLVFNLTVYELSKRKQINPTNYSNTTNNGGEELLTRDQMIEKLNKMSDDEIKSMLINTISNTAIVDLKSAMLKKNDNTTVSDELKNELKNKFISMSDEEFREQLIDEIRNMSAQDARSSVMNKINNIK